MHACIGLRGIARSAVCGVGVRIWCGSLMLDERVLAERRDLLASPDAMPHAHAQQPHAPATTTLTGIDQYPCPGIPRPPLGFSACCRMLVCVASFSLSLSPLFPEEEGLHFVLLPCPWPVAGPHGQLVARTARSCGGTESVGACRLDASNDGAGARFSLGYTYV